MKPPIAILMAAYDGELYIGDQIDSILAQTDDRWHLTIQDDGSRDATLAVARMRASDHPGRITVRARSVNSGSAMRNFFELLLSTDAPYAMFADDDDVWLPEKIAVTRDAMTTLERRFGPQTPILVHTDLAVTDAHLATLSPSMARSQRLDGGEARLSRLLVQNTVTGCTVMINRALADLVRPPFTGIAMHDWWLALVASAFGKIGYVASPTVLYRQHGRNAVGASDVRSVRYTLGRLIDADGSTRRLEASYRQAEAFLDHFGSRLSASQLTVVRDYASLPSLAKPARLAMLRRHGFWKNTTVRRLGQVWFV